MGWLSGQIDILRTRYARIPAGEPHELPGKLIVSLTSYPPRFPTLDLTLRCLLAQATQPDAIVLWLTVEDREKLPARVTVLLSDKLIVRTIDRDIGPFGKIIPALRAYPDDFIVTADDDVHYGRNWLRALVDAYKSPTEIVCLRAYRIKIISGAIAPYSEWEREIEGVGGNIFPTGHGGVLYPPHVLPNETTEEATFTRLCPKADDVWLYWMAAQAGRTFRCVKALEAFRSWRGSKDSGLYHFNTVQGGNDRQIAAMVDRFGLPATPGTFSGNGRIE